MEYTELKEKIGNCEITLQTGKVARQADGAIWVQTGGTIVLVTAVSSKNPSSYKGFMPLTVDYREKFYAAGKIPGGFFKREGRPYEHEVLISRLIDRPVRPLFPKDYTYETQVLASVISFDQENEPDILGIIGASAALSISDIPFNGPFGAVRIALIEGEYIVNPTVAQREKATLDLVVAGTDKDIIMVEGTAIEVSEATLLEVLKTAQPALSKIVRIQQELIEKIGKPKREYEPDIIDPKLDKAVRKLGTEKIRELIQIESKSNRQDLSNKLSNSVIEKLIEEYPESEGKINLIMDSIRGEIIRKMILNEKRRSDGRDSDEIREISIELGILPRAHGSALFTRGETQSLSAVTLGTKLDEQKIEDLEGESFKSFILHYNFLPFSVGDVRPMRGPGRREIGHGNLAERSLQNIIPSEETFPYTIRIVSEILESNGSSSMATVCSGSLSLMDAGIPIKTHVAGIAMGLVIENGKHAILTDIKGSEDHYGDMDFKVTGTEKGINAFQMDVKVPGISFDIIEKALSQAKVGREFILRKMNEVIDKPRSNLAPHAPRIQIIHINPEKIGEVIGSGGKVIRSIQEETSTTIAIEPDGSVFISALDTNSMNSAIKIIESIVEEPVVGAIYNGTVVRIQPFGAFVKITHSCEGLLHISEIEHRRINKVEDVLKTGEKVKVKVLAVDPESGKIRLSRKALLKKERTSNIKRDDKEYRGNN